MWGIEGMQHCVLQPGNHWGKKAFALCFCFFFPLEGREPAVFQQLFSFLNPVS